MSKRLRMRFRRRDREGYEASTIFTSAVRSLFLPLLDTSGESDQAEPKKKKNTNQKAERKQPPPASEPEERPLVNDAEECGDAESPRRPSAVSIPRIDVPPESEEVTPVQVVPPTDDPPSSGLQPISTEFRQVSPTFRRGRFSITELEVVNIDTERLRKIRAESDGQEQSPSPSAREDSKDDTIDDDKAVRSSTDAKSAQDKDDSGVSSSSGCDKTDAADQVSDADHQQDQRKRPAKPQPDTREQESRKSPSLTPVDKENRNGFFIPTTPTVRRGRFNVTQLEVSTSESSCDRAEKTQPDDTCYNIDDIRDEEKEDDEPTSQSFTKPLKSILRRHSDADTTTLDSETVTMLAEDAAGGATDEDAKTPSTEEEGEQDGSTLARLPFTPRHLDDILQPPAHLQRKKSVRFTEPMLLDKISFAPMRDDDRDKNTMNGGSDSNDERDDEGSEEDKGAETKRFSLASWRPQCLQQHMVKKELYVMLYILVGVVHGAALTYTVSVVSAVERKFGFNSKLTGSLLAGNDMSQVIFSMILNYHGRCRHRLRWIGVGMAFAVAACLSAGIPHLLHGVGREAFGADLAALLGNATDTLAGQKEELCFFVGEESCASKETGVPFLGTILLLFLSQFFIGIGITVFYTLGVPFLDNNIDKKTFPLYYGVTLTLRVLGPVLGYLLGSLLLKAWIDPMKVPSLVSNKSQFIDVWWTGSLCIVCGLAISASLSFLFPRRVPESFRRRIRKILAREKVEEEASRTELKAKEFQIGQIPKEAWESTKRIFSNKIWALNLFNTTLFALAVSGYWTLRPQYLESQFRKRATDANFFIGLSSLLSPMFGMGLSGVILLWMRPKAKVLMGYSVFVTLCGGAAYVGLIFAGCPKLDIVGPVAGSLTPPCSADCGCSGRFSPMCSEDQITLFYSPCYAGCNLANTTANPTVYYGCSCIEPANGLSSRPSPDSDVSYTTTGLEGQVALNQGGQGTPGYCPESCAAFFNYVVLLILTQSVYPSARVSNVIIMLRSVPDEDKVMALSILIVFVSVFAFIPAPVFVSAVVDSACLVWDFSCGETSHCWLYNSDKFRTIFHLIPAVFVFICVLCDVVVFCYSRNSELFDEGLEELEKMRGCTEEAKPLRSVAYDEAKEHLENESINLHKYVPTRIPLLLLLNSSYGNHTRNCTQLPLVSKHCKLFSGLYGVASNSLVAHLNSRERGHWCNPAKDCRIPLDNMCALYAMHVHYGKQPKKQQGLPYCGCHGTCFAYVYYANSITNYLYTCKPTYCTDNRTSTQVPFCGISVKCRNVLVQCKFLMVESAGDVTLLIVAVRAHDPCWDAQQKKQQVPLLISTMIPKKEDDVRLRKMVEAGEITYTEEELEETLCGIGSCKPAWLQRLATKEMYLAVYILVALVQGMFFAYSVSVISTIEKRFKFTSKQTGTFLSTRSMIVLKDSIMPWKPVAARWLGVGVMFTAASCFSAALPHLMYGPGQDAIDLADATTFDADAFANSSLLAQPKKQEELCHKREVETCEEEGSAFVGPILLMFLAQFFVGIAISIFFSVGVTYLDDNISKKTYPIYYTLVSLLRVLGPVFGFVLGGRCLSMWIDPSKKPNISRKDPRWLGAWWIGFVFLGVALVLAGNLLFFFPKKLPATLRRETKRMIKQMDKDREEGGNKDFEHFAALAKKKKTESKPTFKNLLKALRRLFTNRIWVGNLFNAIVTLLGVSGYWSFKPKYMENQFRKSATDANYFTGMSSLIVSVVGAGVGGTVLRWARPSPRVITGYNIFTTLVGCGGFIALMFVGCPRLEVVGPVDGKLGPQCSNECGCSDKFTPVCSEDQTTLFYSPCYAGCSMANATADPIIYTGCRCVDSLASASTPSPFTGAGSQDNSTWGYVTRGYCPEPCDGFFYYMLTQIIVQTVASVGRLGGSIVQLRAVAEEDKGIALGTLTVFISLFAFIPAPIIMGAIIDSACLVWDKSCGKTGNCWLYDSDKFRKILHLVPAVLMFISLFGDVVVFWYSDRLDLYGLKAEEELELKKVKGEGEGEGEESNPLKGEDKRKEKKTGLIGEC
ncbi:uncharacterized protein LOC122260222 [Penaeus japonicus]|uniref:uncharacterized protein LOC122260222 n=1 Tax=Penaeus japonicus TaxID=27405 RepID=UPI001C713856|nr:uncharacterized protein LOC122260222 [Penaeus japonicus]